MVGQGEEYETTLKELDKKGELFYINKKFTPMFALQLLAGVDFFLSPSLIEPCGLMPMSASLYGTIPIVSQIGGLKDNFNENNAILIRDFDLEDSLKQAFALYKDKTELQSKINLCMNQKFGWTYRKDKFRLIYEEKE